MCWVAGNGAGICSEARVSVTQHTDTSAYALPQHESQLQTLLNAVPDDIEAGRQLMHTLTFLSETEPSAGQGYLQRAEWLANRGAHDRRMASARDRLRRLSRWQPVEIARRHAGVYLHEIDRFSPESELWRLRNLFLPPWREGQTLLNSGQQLDLAFEVPAATALRIDAQKLSLPGKPLEPIQLRVQHQDRTTTSLLHKPVPRIDSVLELAPGAHRISVHADAPNDSGAVKVALSQLIDGEWHQITRTVKRRYFMADNADSVELGVRGPAWLRVDQLAGMDTVSRYQYLAPGQALEPLQHLKVSEQTSYRVLARRFEDDTADADSPARMTPNATAWPALGAAEAEVHGLTWPTPAAQQDDTAALKRQDAPTYSLASAWHGDDESPEDGRFPVDDFLETIGSRRHRDPTGRHFDETNLVLRQRSAGDSVGATYYRWRSLEDAPLTLRADARVFAQKFDGRWEWSAQGRLAARHTLRANTRRHHTSEVNVFSRYVSTETGTSAYDPDVYTSYRRDHLNGVEAKHTVYWRTHRDAEWYGGVNIRSNELAQASTDYLRARWGGRVQAGRLQMGAEYQLSHYLTDADRNSKLTVPRLKMRGRWYGKPTARGRLEVASELRYDFDINRTSGMLRFTWHFDRDQALHDFHGERYWLDDLLQRRLSEGEQP